MFVVAAGGWAAQARTGEPSCLSCHSAPGLGKRLPGGGFVSLYVDEEAYRQSAHGKRSCTDCHTDPGVTMFPHRTPVREPQCSRCHFMGNPMGAPALGSLAEYVDSVHGQAVKRGDPDAPKCKDCHGYHDVRPSSDPRSSVNRGNITSTCGKCHADEALARKRHMPAVGSYKLYRESVHGRTANGHAPAAVCVDCHGAHDIKSADDPMSAVNRKHIPGTCGRCHREIYDEYDLGIHGRALRQGVKDAPVCTTCHGEHNIRPRAERASSVYPTHVVATCSKCHEDVRMQRQYALPANRLSTYVQSYHGIANEFGQTTVANCSTCHGSHLILPSSDPRSATNRRNLPKTCGKCHPGAGSNFAKGSIHLLPSARRDAVVYWVQVFYRLFIFGMIASFAGYIALDLISRWRRRRGRVYVR